MNNDRNEFEQSSVSEEAPAQRVDSVQSRRRKLLRAGLKASPIVVATLAARPSLACHCIVPSAWGSISTGMGGPQETGDLLGANTLTGSLTRFGGAIHPFNDMYHFSAYEASSGQGWIALRNHIHKNGKNSSVYPAKLFADMTNPDDSDKKNRRLAYLQGLYANEDNGISTLKVSDFCSKLDFAVPAGAGTNTPLALISLHGFGASVLIAQMNMYIYPPDTVPASCISKAALASMAVLTYKPQGAGQPWTKEQVADYLHYNWIARR